MRKYYYLNAYICGVASFAYFAMFSGKQSDLGNMLSCLPIPQHSAAWRPLYSSALFAAAIALVWRLLTDSS